MMSIEFALSCYQLTGGKYHTSTSIVKHQSIDVAFFFMYHCGMSNSMFIVTLDEAIKERGVTLYGVARDSRVPYNTLLRLVQNKGKQTSIDLSVLSRLCITLDCTPNDLLRHVLDTEDKAIQLALSGRDVIPQRGRPKKGAK